MVRRLTSAFLILGFYFSSIAPVFALYTAQSGKMSCCKRSRGHCCKMHEKQRTETGWAAANECSRPCSVNAVSPQIGDSLAPASAGRFAEPAICVVVSVAEEIHPRPDFYLAFLYQLPPPTLAS